MHFLQSRLSTKQIYFLLVKDDKNKDIFILSSFLNLMVGKKEKYKEEDIHALNEERKISNGILILRECMKYREP
jgi:hypothetical protein